MTIITDSEYRRAKQRVVDEDRRQLIRAFVDKYGPEVGLNLLSRRTGQPLALYRRIASSMKFTAKGPRRRKRRA